MLDSIVEQGGYNWTNSAVEFVDFVCSAQNVLLILTLGTMAKVAAPAAILVHQVYVTLEFL